MANSEENKAKQEHNKTNCMTEFFFNCEFIYLLLLPLFLFLFLTRKRMYYLCSTTVYFAKKVFVNNRAFVKMTDSGRAQFYVL